MGLANASFTRRIRRYAYASHPALRGMRADARWRAYSRTTINPEAGYVYFRIPKNANSTIAKTLLYHHDPDGYDPSQDSGARIAKGAFRRLWGSRCYSLAALRSSYLTFAFARNPYSRLLSAYLDKTQTPGKDASYRWVAAAMGRESARELSFEEFVTYLEQGGLRANTHWFPQSELLPVGAGELDFLGRVETLETDAQALISRIYGADRWRGLQSASNATGARSRLVDYYDEGLARRVRDLYARDFEELGYDGDLEAAT